MMMFGFLALLLVGGLFVALILGGGSVFLLKQGGDSNGSHGSQKATTREILDQRLARGEISQEEYKRIRDQVES